MARQRLTLVSMCMSQGMILLDITIVNIALPSMQRELHLSPGWLEWVISAYALSLAALIPVGGTLGDRYGRRRVFLVGLLVFTAASAGCALSSSDLMLIGFRVLQGVGGAVMSALTLSILSETFPPERRAGAIGIWAAIAGLGFGAGPILGGLLLAVFDWGSIFWVNVPVGLLAVVITWVGVKESKDPVPRSLDVVGLVLCALGLAGLTLGLIESSSLSWGSPLVLASLLGGLVMLGLFVGWERRVDQPMVPLALFTQRTFAWSSVVYLLIYASLTSVMFYATLLFQDVRGWSPLRTGLSWICMNLPYLATAQAAGRLHRRFSPVTITVTGALSAGVGILVLSRLTATTPFVVAAAGYILLGTGYALMVPALSNLAMSRVPAGFSGIASGVFNTSRQVGTSIGLAVLGAVGVAAAKGSWSTYVAGLAPTRRASAGPLGQSVAGGQLGSLHATLGKQGVTAATDAFLHGYQLAVGVAGGLVILAAALVLVGMRSPAGRDRRARRAQPLAAGPEVRGVAAESST